MSTARPRQTSLGEAFKRNHSSTRSSLRSLSVLLRLRGEDSPEIVHRGDAERAEAAPRTLKFGY
jgi:hypothetical protein